jgi:calpain-5
MTFEDFCRYFVNMSICHRVNVSFMSLQKTWRETLMDGQWNTPDRAGGCSNNKSTFFNNPQFIFDISDDKDEVMVHLMQKTSRGHGIEKQSVGFTIQKVEDNRRYRVHTVQDPVGSSVFRNSRGVYMRQSLVRGRYLIIPCTFEPNVVGQFLLRLYSGHGVDLRELNKDKPHKSVCSCLPCLRLPTCVTRIKVRKATGLERADRNGDVNAYCVVQCEREKIQTPVVEKNKSPEWPSTAGIFYRKKPSTKPVIIDVYHSKIGIDEFLGRAIYDKTDEIEPSIITLPLKDKDPDKDGASQNRGQLVISVTTTRRLDSL